MIAPSMMSACPTKIGNGRAGNSSHLRERSAFVAKGELAPPQTKKAVLIEQPFNIILKNLTTP